MLGMTIIIFLVGVTTTVLLGGIENSVGGFGA